MNQKAARLGLLFVSLTTFGTIIFPEYTIKNTVWLVLQLIIAVVLIIAIFRRKKKSETS